MLLQDDELSRYVERLVSEVRFAKLVRKLGALGPLGLDENTSPNRLNELIDAWQAEELYIFRRGEAKMNWIDDDRQELRRLELSETELAKRNEEIGRYAETVYNDLWAELLARIAEAATAGLPKIITNGSPFSRKLIIPVEPKPDESSAPPAEVELQLSQDKTAILVRGALNLHFNLDLGPDNVAFLRQGGDRKSIQDAAQLILRPLLFPKLFGAARR